MMSCCLSLVARFVFLLLLKPRTYVQSRSSITDQILRRERGQGNIIFPSSADHEHWRPRLINNLAICVTIRT